MRNALLTLGLLTSVLSSQQAKTEPIIYNQSTKGGEFQTVGQEDSGLAIRKSDLSFQWPSGAKAVTLSPDKKTLAAICGEKDLSVTFLNGKAAKRLHLSDITEVKSLYPESIIWVTSSRFLVYLNDPSEKGEDKIACYDLDGGSLSWSIHDAESEINEPFVRYDRKAKSAYEVLLKEEVVLIGHHRALPYTAQEIFGYGHGTGLGAISKDGDLVIMRDLHSREILVFKQGEPKKHFVRKSEAGVEQMRVSGALILIRTTDGQCEVWDSRNLTYLRTIDCHMILDGAG